MKLDFTVEGTSELLTHNPTGLFLSAIPPKPGSKGVKQVLSREDVAEQACYRLDDGSCGLPVLAFRQAIMEAAKDFKLEKRKGSWATKLKGCSIEPMEFIPLMYGKKPATEYQIDSRRAVNTRLKAAIIVHRPKFPPGWRTSFSLIIDDFIFGDDVDTIRIQLGHIINDAGIRIGVGSFRPVKGGWFGKFKVV